MSKRCCKYHNKLCFVETDLTECGHSGMGTPIVCCKECPENMYPSWTAIYYKTDPECEEDRAEWEDMYESQDSGDE